MTLATTLADITLASGHRLIDFGAFFALAIVWMLVALLVYSLFHIIRARADGAGWDGTAGL